MAIFLEYLISLLVFIFRRWWLIVPLVAIIYYILRRLRLISPLTIGVLVGVPIGLIVFSFVISPYLFSPVFNYFGRLAIAEVQSSTATLFTDAAYNRIYAVKANYVDENGTTQNISYWDKFEPVSPIFTHYRIPQTPEQLFFIKYLPLIQSEFVFITKFSESDKKVYFPKLQMTLSTLRTQYETKHKESSEFLDNLTQDLSPIERHQYVRKIYSGENLTALEQQAHMLAKDSRKLKSKIDFIEASLAKGDFCFQR